MDILEMNQAVDRALHIMNYLPSIEQMTAAEKEQVRKVLVHLFVEGAARGGQTLMLAFQEASAKQLATLSKLVLEGV